MRMTMTLGLVGALGLATLGVAAQSPSGTSTPGQQTITVTGCLQSARNNTFTLTTLMPPPGGAAAPAATGTSGTTSSAGRHMVSTMTYALTPGNGIDLSKNVGQKVQITGTRAPGHTADSETERTVAREQAQDGAGKPVVKTTARERIVVSRLTVTALRPVASKCDILR